MAAAEMTAFDGYLEDFSSARGDALKAIDAYDRCSDRGKREELVVEARSAIEEVERYVRVLENEAKNSTSSAAKRKMTEQVLRCKTQCGTLKSNLEKAILTGDAKAKKSDGPSSASNDPVEQAQEDTEEAKGHIRRLAIKAVTSKLCLIFVMVCLAVAIALVSYYKWYPKNKKDYLGILPNTSAPAASTTGRL